jgi:hypothetical protein
MVASFTRLSSDPNLATDYDPVLKVHTLKVTGISGGGGTPAGTTGQVQINNAGAFGAIADGTVGQALLSNGPGVAPSWNTLAGGGNALTTNPLSQFAATTSLQLAGVISDETGSGPLVFAVGPAIGLVNATGLPLATGVTGTLSISHGGTGQTAAGAAFNALSPMTTGGDLIYGGASGAGTRLANGTVGQVLTSGGTTVAPTWSTPASSGLTIGTTSIASGTTLRLLYDNGAVLGEISGVTTDGTKLIITSAELDLVSSPLVLSGNISAASWGGATIAAMTGLRIKGVTGTMTDTSTAASTTVVNGATDLLGGNTIAATNTGVVYTNYYSSYFKAPVAGTNVTFTNSAALGADSLTVTGKILTPVGGVGGIGVGIAGNASNSIASAGGFLVSTTAGLGYRTFGLTFGSAQSVSWSDNVNQGSGTLDTSLFRLGVANIRQGNAPSATPIAQLFTIGEASRSGTDSNVGGANGTLQSGLGTGTGPPSILALQSPKAAASGTAAQTYITGLVINDGAAVLTSYTVANLPAAATVGAGGTAFVTDASTTLILGLGGAVAGGGANKVPVYSDGTSWLYG